MRTLRAAMLTRIESSVARTASLRSMGSNVSDSLPDMSWLASSRSPNNCVCARALRSMTFSPSRMVGGVDAGRCSSVVQPRMALSGVRSSCEMVARNSSLAWLAATSSLRAARSAVSSASRSASSSLRRVTSRKVPTMRRGRPAASADGRGAILDPAQRAVGAADLQLRLRHCDPDAARRAGRFGRVIDVRRQHAPEELLGAAGEISAPRRR